MIEEYRKEEKIIERNEFQKEEDLIKIIIKTKENIKNANKFLNLKIFFIFLYTKNC